MSNNLLKKMTSESVRAYTASSRCDDSSASGNHTDNKSSGGGNKLEARVVALENAIPEIRERLVRVETKLDSVEARLKNVEENMATKTDLEALRGSITADLHIAIAGVHKSLTEMTWRFIQISLVLAGVAFTAGKFIN